MTVPTRALIALAVTVGIAVPATYLLRGQQEHGRLLLQQRDLLVTLHEELRALRASLCSTQPQVPQPREYTSME